MGKPRSIPAIPPAMTGNRSHEELRDYVMSLFMERSEPRDIHEYRSPDLYNRNRVTYIIPPVTDIEHRSEWNPRAIHIVQDGVVAVGRVSYTRTSGEYLIEELILRRGDIFGEFEVPLSILGHPEVAGDRLPPRFNMTYGAWASGPSLNWAMAYPRDILRDSVDPDNAISAVHPFYIKSKNIRPATGATVISMPAERFEDLIRTSPETMTWFLLNVLRKTRLYFEPPSSGYSRSPSDLVARLVIRILAYRIRHGLVVMEEHRGITSCRTFLGPTEWLRYGLGSFTADLREVIQEAGGTGRDPVVLPVFSSELESHIVVTAHHPVKDLDDAMLIAMGCSPEEDRADNRYGLLSGLSITLDDLAFFNHYLTERGE